MQTHKMTTSADLPKGMYAVHWAHGRGEHDHEAITLGDPVSAWMLFHALRRSRMTNVELYRVDDCGRNVAKYVY